MILGDAIVASLTMDKLPRLGDHPAPVGSAVVLFKGCGSALLDLAAARSVVAVTK